MRVVMKRQTHNWKTVEVPCYLKKQKNKNQQKFPSAALERFCFEITQTFCGFMVYFQI